MYLNIRHSGFQPIEIVEGNPPNATSGVQSSANTIYCSSDCSFCSGTDHRNIFAGIYQDSTIKTFRAKFCPNCGAIL